MRGREKLNFGDHSKGVCLHLLFGHTDAEELSSSAGSSTDSEGFKNVTCFMAIEDNQVTSTPSSSDDEDDYEVYV